MAAMIPAPFTPAWLIPLLGLGLGACTPANSTLVMSAIPAQAAGTGGGLVNMTRGLGTALGVALVTLVLHLAHGVHAAANAATALLAANHRHRVRQQLPTSLPRRRTPPVRRTAEPQNRRTAEPQNRRTAEPLEL